MKLSNRLGIVFPQMSENKPRYEYESWLLPYKPMDTDEENNVFKKPDSNYFEVNKARKKPDEFIRDSKNRRILSREALLEDKLVDPDNIPGLSNVTNPSNDPGIPASSTCQVTTIPVSANVPGPSASSGPNLYPGFSSSSFASFSPTSDTTPDSANMSGPNLYPGFSSTLFPSFSITSDTTPVSGKKGREKSQKGQRVAKNPLQRKLEKALATPVTMSKAESMMLKMGWSGGALGKTGGGIIEPIVPNLVYATSTKGFGQAPPSPKPTKKAKQLQTKSSKTKNNPDKVEKQQIRLEKRQQRLRLKTVFKENVMRYILDFINNEREIGILFDKSLHNGQRKIIHCIVQEIRQLNECDVKSKIMNASNDRLLLMNIASKNKYVLQTQSEGNHPNRYLSLFKEAPESMYLITHYKLNDKESDFVKREQEDHPRHRFKSKKQKKAEKWLEQNARLLCQQLIKDKCAIDKESKDKINQESIDTCTVRKIDDDIIEIDCESDNENDSESENETVDESNEFNAQITDADYESNKEKKAIDIDDEINEIVERTAAGACRITKSDEVLDMDKKKIETGNPQTNESVVKNNNENIIKSEVKVEQMIEETKPTTDNETTIKISITSSSRKEFMRYNLNMCFSDFMAGTAYKTFKFLGEFDEEEFEVLNEFLRDFFLVKNDEPALDEEFMGVWNQANCKLSYKRDLNGGIVIYKVL